MRRKSFILCGFSRKHAQRGFGLIDAMVAVVIFGFGMAALAALYVRMAPQPLQNTNVVQVQMAANSLIGALTSDTDVLPLSESNVTSADALPASLQGWFSQQAALLPGFTLVSLTSSNGPTGRPCSPAGGCVIDFTLAWTQMGTVRQQAFHTQIGIL
jgi:Tfp pilus assembly protein PilV